MRVALLANLKENAPAPRSGATGASATDAWDDLDSAITVKGIAEALRSAGHTVRFLEASLERPHRLIERLLRWKPDTCFNIAEGHYGESRESLIPAILDELCIPYTGSGPLSLAVALDKPSTKRLLNLHGLPTPAFQVVSRADEPISPELAPGGELPVPLFAKPSREGTGMGVSGSSILRSMDELRRQLAWLLDAYQQPVLLERFVPGRELTVGLVGTAGSGLTVLPALEVNGDAYDPGEAGIYTNRVKVELVHSFHYTCPAELEPALEAELGRLATEVFRVLGCRDVARVDFRVDGEQPWILEVNPLPGLNAEYSDLCIEARAHGWSYEELVGRILEAAMARS